jgi:predicted alpha/beta-hydrolase family hydrolase
MAAWDPAELPTGPVVVFAHGAGGHMDDRAVLATTSALRERGIGTVRFNFFYRARKSARPDPMPQLLACFDAVVARTCAELDPPLLIVGGRSMGGRAASVFAAGGGHCDGLLLLAYPLHPPGQPEKVRVAHLPDVHVPVMCMNGTRDPFCDPGLMRQTLESLGANWHMQWIEDADHSFHVPRRSGRTDAGVLADMADQAARWIASLRR